MFTGGGFRVQALDHLDKRLTLNDKIMNILRGALRRILLCATALATAFAAGAAEVDDAAAIARNDSINRAVATVMSAGLNEVLDNLTAQNVPLDRAAVGRYIAACLAGEPQGFTRDEAIKFVDTVVYASMPDAAPDTVSVESQKTYVDSIAAMPGALLTPSGLVFVVITEGEGEKPTIKDRVDVRYRARLSDGTVFDDTGDNPVTFDVSGVVPGFTEGLMMMKPGGTYRLVIPAEHAYGRQGIPGIIPGNSALDFTITLDRVSH